MAGCRNQLIRKYWKKFVVSNIFLIEFIHDPLTKTLTLLAPGGGRSKTTHTEVFPL